MNKILKLFAYTLVVAVVFSSCKKFVDVNNDPNNNQSTSANFVITGALGTTYRNQVSTFLHIVPGTWTGIYGHSTSFTGEVMIKRMNLLLRIIMSFNHYLQTLKIMIM